MILVTVGTQLPFDRLIRMVDELAPTLGGNIFAQTGLGTHVPKNIEWSANLSPTKFEGLVKDASVIVSHAGIGTVIKAFKYSKPIVLVPRLASLGEHRNDHQLATVSQLGNRPGIYVASNADELMLLLGQDLTPAIAAEAVSEGRERLRSFVRQQVKNSINGTRR